MKTHKVVRVVGVVIRMRDSVCCCSLTTTGGFTYTRQVGSSFLEMRKRFYNQGLCPFFEEKIQRLFKDTFLIFRGLHSMIKESWSLSFSVLPQRELFYPEGLSVFAPFRHLRIWVGQSWHQY